MKGKIIVIEGVDACGKQTQASMLAEELKKRGLKVATQSFPNYESQSSGAAKMYLSGELGKHADDVNPYAASMLFAADRICTMSKYKDFLNAGGILILDRYMESNLIHQGSKFTTEEEKQIFENNWSKIEYELAGLPKPSCVFFLDVKPEISAYIISQREENKSGTSADIHEQDTEYLKKSYNHGIAVAKRNGWKIVPCCANNRMLKKHKVLSQILNYVDSNGILSDPLSEKTACTDCLTR